MPPRPRPPIPPRDDVALAGFGDDRPVGRPVHGRRGGPRELATARPASRPSSLAAAVDPGGLRREVFGFLPYWELTDSSTRLDWEKLSTVAYFGVGADGTGNLQQAERGRLDDGRLERLDQLEDDQRHQRRPRAATPGSS